MLPRFIPHVLGDQTGTQLPHITLAGIRAFRIPLPPLDVQRTSLRKLRWHRLLSIAEAESITLARRHAESLRRSILASAFRGELVPQDPNDEPASVLLERIAAERAAAPKPARKRRERAPA